MREDVDTNILEHEDVAGPVDLGDGVRPLLVNKRNAARILGGITEREVDKRIAAGDLEGVKLGKRALVYLPSIEAYVEQLRAARAAA
jgi:hypothetical protein